MKVSLSVKNFLYSVCENIGQPAPIMACNCLDEVVLPHSNQEGKFYSFLLGKVQRIESIDVTKSREKKCWGNWNATSKAARTVENPARQQTTFRDIQINIKHYWQIYVSHIHVQSLKNEKNIGFWPSKDS